MTGGIPDPALPPLSSSFGPGLSLDTTLGAYLIGTFFSLPLYGLSVHQLYRYCRLFPKDTTYIRTLVAIVMLLETIHATVLMHSCYYYLTTNYDNPNAFFETPVWSVAVTPLVSTVVGFVSEIFFARRVSMLGSMHKIIAIIAMICLLTQIGCSSESVRQMYAVGTFDGLASEAKALGWVAGTGYGCAALADILLSSCIIRALRRSRARHEQADTLLDVLMLYVVNTGLLIGLCSTTAFVLAVVDPNELRWASFNIITCRLCANTLLSVLNSRRLSISRGMEIFDDTSLGRNIIARANELAIAERWDVPQVPDNRTAPIQVGVKTEVETDSLDGPHKSGECPHLRMDLKLGGLLEDV